MRIFKYNELENEVISLRNNVENLYKRLDNQNETVRLKCEIELLEDNRNYLNKQLEQFEDEIENLRKRIYNAIQYLDDNMVYQKYYEELKNILSGK